MSDAPARTAPKPSIGHWLEYGALRTVVAALSVLPWRAVGALGGFIGRLGFWPLRIRRGVVDAQIAASFPDTSVAEHRRIASESYAHLGRLAVETAIVSRLTRGTVLDLFEEPSGWEHIAGPIAKGQGVILVSAHLGNWELGVAYIAARGVQLSGVVRRMGNPLFDGYLTRSRNRFGWNVVRDRDAARAIPRAVAAAHAVIMLADQGVKGLSSVFVPFFGRPARTPKGPAVFAIRLEVPVVIAVFPREPSGKYRCCFEPLTVELTGNREYDIEATVAAYTRAVEGWVRKYPGQYLWQHRRWRRRPDGTLAY